MGAGGRSARPRYRAHYGAPTRRRPAPHGGHDPADGPASRSALHPIGRRSDWECQRRVGAGDSAARRHPSDLNGCMLTTLSVADRAASEPVLQYYSYRWRVERDHYGLKSGCHLEDLPLETQPAGASARRIPHRGVASAVDDLSRPRTARPAPLGGFWGRRGDGDPGVKTLWRGYRRLEDPS